MDGRYQKISEKKIVLIVLQSKRRMKKRSAKEKYRHHTPSNMSVAHTVRIFNETAVRIPRTAMTTLYTDLLAKTCSLHIVCIGNAFSQKLHKAHRGKDALANILTFPPNDSGVAEMYINTVMAAQTAKKHRISTKKQILFLCIHGMLHLLGYQHGVQMEMLEDRYITMYT